MRALLTAFLISAAAYALPALAHPNRTAPATSSCALDAGAPRDAAKSDGKRFSVVIEGPDHKGV